MARSEAPVVCNWMTSCTLSAAKRVRLALLADDRLLVPLEAVVYRRCRRGRGSVGDVDDHVPVVLLAGSRNPKRALVDDANREGGLSLE